MSKAYPARRTFPNEKVQFVNERTGWIVGPSLLRTDDGGKSWTRIRYNGAGTIVSEFIDNEQASEPLVAVEPTSFRA